MLSAAHVRRKATSGSIGKPQEASLRSLYWRVSMPGQAGEGSRDLPQANWVHTCALQISLGVLSASPAVWPEALRRLRQSWTDLHDYLRAPDGTWVDGANCPPDWRGNTASFPVYDPLGQEPGVRLTSQ